MSSLRQPEIRQVFVAAIAALMLIGGCSSGGGSNNSPVLSTVTISLGSASLAPGATTSVTVTATNSNGSSASTAGVTYASSNSGVATVSSSGTVTAVAPGTATITATIGTVTSSGATVTVAWPTYTIVDPNATAPTLTAFGGLAASITSSGVPSGGPSGSVMKLAANTSDQCYHGTTISTGFNLSVNKIPVNTAPSKITVVFYSPIASVDVKLKLEDASDPTHTVETDVVATTTGWQTLTFDFTHPTTGTAALNSTYTYDKVSLFPDFYCGGSDVATAAQNYYVGPLTFVGAAASAGAAYTTTNVSDGFNSNGTTVVGSTTGLYGFYAGGAASPAQGNGGGLFADVSPGTAATSYLFQYTNDSLANLTGYVYEGIFVKPAVSSSLTPNSYAGIAFNASVNQEWASVPGQTANAVVLITSHVANISTAQCDPAVAAVVPIANSTPAALYLVPWTSFTFVAQNCGSSSVTAAQILAGTLVQFDLQADGAGAAITASGLTSNINTAVPDGTGNYPTAISLAGAVTLYR
jgi:Bacterial Ig-like domain (group 2)